jgi:hypothetical protein
VGVVEVLAPSARTATDPVRSPGTDLEAVGSNAGPAIDRLGSRLLAVIVGTAAVLRLWNLGHDRLGFDESFTAMAGRLPLGTLLSYLRVRDSHPPLDYLLRAPLARAGASELLLRLPSVACSVAAVALFAWWMRRRGWAGIIATGLLAISAFQIQHGREARMYADFELIGVAAAVLADSWLRRPRAWHAATIGLLTFVGLLIHVEMFLLGAGLLALAGLRTDRAAWWWRGALAAGFGGWAAVWGSSFIVQSRGRHSDWIPRTTVTGVMHTAGSLVTSAPELHLAVLLGVAAGAWLLGRSDRRLARVWLCCVLVPFLIAAVVGLQLPVLIDRTFTFAAWGPLLALGYLAAWLAQRRRILGVALVVALASVMLPATLHQLQEPSAPDQLLRHVQHVARPGDVVASLPSGRLHEIAWSLGVRGDQPSRSVRVTGVPGAQGILIGGSGPSGRVWLLQWSHGRSPTAAFAQCAPSWRGAGARVQCVEMPSATLAVANHPLSWSLDAPR